MDDRYRSKSYRQDNRGEPRRSAQDEQFSSSGAGQYGETGWRTQENERWQSGPDYDRGYGRNDPFGRDWSSSGSSQSNESSGLDDYDSFGSQRFSQQDRQQGRSYAPPRDTSSYGADRQGSYGSGGYQRQGHSGDRFSRQGHIPPRRYDPDERDFFERASDTVMSWFGDEDAARRREMDQRADHRGKGPAGYTRSKERILEDANERLMHDSSLDASKITVSCENNEITLDGTVDSRAAKRRAEDIVHDVSGVKHVQNNLRVESGQSYYSETSTARDS